MSNLNMKIKAAVFSMFMVVLIITQCLHVFASSEQSKNSFGKQQIDKIDKLLSEKINSEKIPGCSVVVVNTDGVIYNKGFGYSNIKEKQPVTSATPFVLGSYDEILTSLGILKLCEQGVISPEDSISKYIPALKFKYKDNYADIKIEHLLNNTTGISFKTQIDASDSSSMSGMENAVMTNSGRELDNNPGDRYSYSAFNYHILKMIIYKETGMQYENFIKNNVLNSPGLENTFTLSKDNYGENIASGYKIAFGGLKEYQSNISDNQFIINADGMGRWLMAQLNVNKEKGSILQKSYTLDYKMRVASDGSYYANGWNISPNGNLIYSTGNSPYSSTLVAFSPEENIGVAILSNINSQSIRSIGLNIINILQGNEQTSFSDYNTNVDRVSIAIICVAVLIILITLFFLIAAFLHMIKRERRLMKVNFKRMQGLGLSVLIVSAITVSIYWAPNVFLNGTSWEYIRVWLPYTAILAVKLIVAAVLVFYIYFLITFLFQKSNDKPYFSIIIFSTISGLGYAFVMFIVNMALSEKGAFKYGLIFYFIMGLVFYVFGQRLVRSQLTVMTNDIIFDKRVELISIILRTSYYKFEKIGNERVYTSLNNDTEIISGSVSVIVLGITSSITIACTFVYLGISSLYALVASIILILIGGVLLMTVNKSAEKYWEQSRDIQNNFFNFIGDLLGGFKELYLHEAKRKEFNSDIEKSCKAYKEGRTQAELVSAYVYFVGELLAFFILGGLVFILPLIFKEVQSATLSDYVLLFLFLKGPIDCVMNMIPRISQLKVSWKRINEIRQQLLTAESKIDQDGFKNADYESINIRLDNVEYSYKNEAEDVFSVGPVSCSFSSGEIVFITGGNGSGKSTLAKLITGLYAPDNGAVYVDGNEVAVEKLGELFSAVFSDYYLFKKLYGVNLENKNEEVQKYLKMLKIENKVQINNGAFSTIKLSTGQKKRLALLISYIDNRPVYIFDEWAADQDPEFRKIFYLTLLPELKLRGKCVIAITHDDRYFDIADKIIKMEAGKVVS